MVTARRSTPLVALALSLCAACGKAPAPSAAPATSGTTASAPAASGTGVTGSSTPRGGTPRARALLEAEQRRASREVTLDDFADRDVNVRRAAARALARIADTRAAELLAKSLADEDPEVVAWSAYGLGYTCKEREAKTVRALVARQASLLAFSTPAGAGAPGTHTNALFEPVTAVADALGRCGGADAERSLRAWLEADVALARAAAFALGTLAARSGRLEDASLVALLDAASRREPLGAALQAFTRLSNLSESVQTRLLDVARRALGDAATRAFAVRALAAAGEPAAESLAEVLAGPTFTPAERADAARGLGRLATPGQNALARALPKLLEKPEATADAALRSAEYGVLTSALAALKLPLVQPVPDLARLAELPLAEERALRRRQVALRCRAAELLAGSGTQSPKLAACDPDPQGRRGKLALLAVLDRGPLRGSRLQAFRALASAEEPLVRERAIELLAGHAEVSGVPELLAQALADKAPGPVATAARFAADYPQRVSLEADALAPAPSVTRALSAAIEAWKASPDIEVRAALLDAAGALQLLAAKPVLEAECGAPNPTVRLHAEKALRLLGDRARRCETATASGHLPEELARLVSKPVELVLTTDAGSLTLTLEPALAPVAVTRITELARSGFYDGVTLHRVVPGFVAQLGDPGGDGYGGAPRPPLRCETSPARFAAGSVGVALGGRDTGSSQFFVTLGEQPHLDGEYPLIGRAGAGWDRIVEGDVVHKISVK
jgi:cyclophilin family peptidyl-prolyl cis-trans isomerase